MKVTYTFASKISLAQYSGKLFKTIQAESFWKFLNRQSKHANGIPIQFNP